MMFCFLLAHFTSYTFTLRAKTIKGLGEPISCSHRTTDQGKIQTFTGYFCIDLLHILNLVQRVQKIRCSFILYAARVGSILKHIALSVFVDSLSQEVLTRGLDVVRTV